MMGLLQISSGITTVIYMKTMPIPLKEHMADNLRSNYTGGFGMGYLERQFDRSVDWVQINVNLLLFCYFLIRFFSINAVE